MKPAVEPMLELREVTLCIFGVKGVIHAAQRALDVAQNVSFSEKTTRDAHIEKFRNQESANR